MIVFDLQCAGGHVFEAWFGSTADYEGQRERGLVSCPVCEDRAIEKAVMAPRLTPASIEAANPQERIKAFMADLARAQSKALEGSEWVGKDFAEEARAIHHGEREQRSIHGQASAEDASSLLAEGIAVTPLPFAVTPPEERN